ncbi:MAG TPA: hypothetical protein VKG91_07645, partial [Roseiarcus sp.]|nr:hypothetical protein [Roseiarcus sp.]
MAQSKLRNGELLALAHVNPQPTANINAGLQVPQLPLDAVADFVLGAPEAAVVALGGINIENLRDLLDQVDPTQNDRIALFARIVPEPTTE